MRIKYSIRRWIDGRRHTCTYTRAHTHVHTHLRDHFRSRARLLYIFLAIFARIQPRHLLKFFARDFLTIHARLLTSFLRARARDRIKILLARSTFVPRSSNLIRSRNGVWNIQMQGQVFVQSSSLSPSREQTRRPRRWQ